MPEGDFTSGPTRQCPDLEGLVVSEVAGAACALSILVAEGPDPWTRASPAGRLDATVPSVTQSLPASLGRAAFLGEEGPLLRARSPRVVLAAAVSGLYPVSSSVN